MKSAHCAAFLSLRPVSPGRRADGWRSSSPFNFTSKMAYKMKCDWICVETNGLLHTNEDTQRCTLFSCRKEENIVYVRRWMLLRRCFHASQFSSWRDAFSLELCVSCRHTEETCLKHLSPCDAGCLLMDFKGLCFTFLTPFSPFRFLNSTTK